MADKKTKWLSVKEQYSAYKSQGRYAKNKRAKLERHLKNYPNDVQAAEALKNIASEPTRKKPETRVWTQPTIELARLYASLGINGKHALGSHRISAGVGDKEHMRFFDPDQHKLHGSGLKKSKKASS